MNDKVGGVGGGAKNNASQVTSDLRAGGFNPLSQKVRPQTSASQLSSLPSLSEVSAASNQRGFPATAASLGRPKQTHFPSI